MSVSGKALADARASAGSRASSAEWGRMEEDVLILNGLGSFFAGLFVAGVLYSIFEESGDPEAGKLALLRYKKARSAWASMAERARNVYVSDVSYGAIPQRRGHWIDRIPAIDTDIAAMEKKVAEKNPNARSAAAAIQIATRAVTSPVMRPSVVCTHTPPAGFHPGSELPIAVAIPSPTVTGVALWYRHVNHGERWKSATMERAAGRYHTAIPGDYTSSPYPLQYYFELRSGKSAWLFPAFDAPPSSALFRHLQARLALCWRTDGRLRYDYAHGIPLSLPPGVSAVYRRSRQWRRLRSPRAQPSLGPNRFLRRFRGRSSLGVQADALDAAHPG